MTLVWRAHLVYLLSKNSRRADLPQNLRLRTCFWPGSSISLGSMLWAWGDLGGQDPPHRPTGSSRGGLWEAVDSSRSPYKALQAHTRPCRKQFTTALCRVLSSCCHHVVVATSWVGVTAHPRCMASPQGKDYTGGQQRAGAVGLVLVATSQQTCTLIFNFFCAFNSRTCCLPGYLGHCQCACSCRLAPLKF